MRYKWEGLNEKFSPEILQYFSPEEAFNNNLICILERKFESFR